MSKRIAVVALIVAAVAMAITGAGLGSTAKKKPKKFDPTCGPQRTKSRRIAHTNGYTTLHGTPKRVVALEFSFIDDLGAVGVKPVGIADDNDRKRVIPAVRAQIGDPVSVGLRSAPNLETIASLHPDLIIADSDRDAKIYKQLQKIAPTIALDSLKQNYWENLHAAIVIGQAVNRCGAMRVRVRQDKAIMQRIKKAVPAGYKKKAMFVVATNKLFNVHDSLAYTPSLFQAIGIASANRVKPGSDPYIVMSFEDLLANNPDVIFAGNYNPGTSVLDQWKSSPLWGHISAAKDKQVFDVNPNLWSRARGIQAGEHIAQQAVHLLFGKYVSIKLPKVTGA